MQSGRLCRMYYQSQDYWAFVFGSSVRNDKNEYFKKIKDTINNLLSNFDSEQDKYGKISECICNSHCNEEFKTNKKCESNKHQLY